MKLTAALFVGGQSTRMGRDKSLVEIRGEPLWMRQIHLLQQVAPERVLLSCREKPGWCPADVIAVADAVSGQGPLGGLVSCLNQTETSHLLALAVDLPQMNIQVLNELWRGARPGCGVVPVIGEFFEPLCAIYPSEALPTAAAALNARRLSLRNLVAELLDKQLISLWSVPEEWVPAFLNANQPSDLSLL